MVSFGSSRLDHGLHSCLGRLVDPISKRKEGVAGHDRPLAPNQRSARGEHDGVHPAHLSRADSNSLKVPGKENRIGLDVLTHSPGEEQVGRLGITGPALGHDP